MKKKLIFVTEALWIGGIETALVNLLNRLDYDQYEVDCLLLRDDRTLAPRLPAQCRLLTADRERLVSFPRPYRFARLYNLCQPTEHPSRAHRLLKPAVPLLRWVENRLYIRYLRRCMAAERYDVAVIYSDRAAEPAVRALRAEQYLMYYHHGAMRRSYHDEIGYRRSRRIIAVSEGIARQLRDFRAPWAEKVIAIPNLVNVEEVRRRSLEATPELLPEDGFHLVTCGRISPEKGMDLAAEACAILLRQGMTELHWWLVGSGPALRDLEAQVRRLGIESHFHILGMRRNPYPYLRRADLYVQPSRFEGHSVTVLEARVLQKPIVATFAAAEGQLRQEVDGLLCDTDAEALAKAIRRCREDAGLRQRFRAALKAHDFEADNQAALRQLCDLMDG